MRPVVTTRSLLAAIEAKRRAEAAQRWTQSFHAPRDRVDAVRAPDDAKATDR